MAYILISDFQIGMDLRKGPVTSPAQSLRVATNCIINSGGEVEKRRAFVHHASVPGTVGLYGANSEFVVFHNNTAGVRTGITGYVNGFGLAGLPAGSAMLAAQAWQDTYFVETWQQPGAVVAYHAGNPIAAGESQGVDARVFETKMYVPWGVNLKYSAINNPANWDALATPANGAGTINISQADSFGSEVLGIERYFQMMAAFGRSTIQLWDMDPDGKLNQISQTIQNTGLYTKGAKSTFANGDVIYLAQTGIRSLKARDSSNFAITTDVGSPIDSYVKQLIQGMNAYQIDRIQAVVEPKTGAFWLSMGTKILVLSFYPSSKISAWSVLEFPTQIDYMAVNDYSLAIRSGDEIYIYGGDYNQSVFDATEVVVQTPFLDAKDPAARKTFKALDAVVEGVWAVRYNVNPRIPDAWSLSATVTDETYTLDTLPMQAQGTHVSFELRTTSALRAKVSSLVCHFEGKQPQ